LTRNIPFHWFSLPAKGTIGGILVGCNKDKFSAYVCDILDFSISIMIKDFKTNFYWKLVVVYGSPYEDGKLDFLNELHATMQKWQGPTMVAGDFNLVRVAKDKSNSVINYRWADDFNEWIHKWPLVELHAGNIDFTWSNRQDRPILAKIDRIFVTTDWDQTFPLARVKGLYRFPSDHNPRLVDTRDNVFLW
jgi:exonuclease III